VKNLYIDTGSIFMYENAHMNMHIPVKKLRVNHHEINCII